MSATKYQVKVIASADARPHAPHHSPAKLCASLTKIIQFYLFLTIGKRGGGKQSHLLSPWTQSQCHLRPPE
jgi:hypothetical protein